MIYSSWQADESMGEDFWRQLILVRTAVNKAMEAERAAGVLRGSLDAAVTLYCSAELGDTLQALGDELRFVLITSSATLMPLSAAGSDAMSTDLPDLRIQITVMEDEKCERCWHRSATVGNSAAHPTLCAAVLKILMVMVSDVSMRNGILALPWFGLALVIILLDQYTKGLASNGLEYAQPVRIFEWLNFTLQHNAGAAFSFLSDAGGWQRYFFSAAAIGISAALAVWLYLMPRGQLLLAISLGMILGGALGNLWDRVALGYVVDFISVHYQGSYFPAFNIADAAISVGAAGMLLDSFLHRDRPVFGEQEGGSMTLVTVSEGTRVYLNFSVSLEDGSEVDTNFGGDSVQLVIGDGSLLPGFERLLFGMAPGDRQMFVVPPENAFGQPNNNNVQYLPRKQFDDDADLGDRAYILFC